MHKVIEKVRNDIRTKAFLDQLPDCFKNNEYNPKLYVRSGWIAPPCKNSLEQKIDAMEEELIAATKQCHRQQPKRSNLTPFQHHCMHALKEDTRFIVLNTDKNLGPAVLERDIYINRVLSEHLQTESYEQWGEFQTRMRLGQLKEHLESLFQKAKLSKELAPWEVTYFTRAMAQDLRIPSFYGNQKSIKNHGHCDPW